MSPIRERCASSGFTLLELLVAITLLGMLLAALFGGLRLGARAWETGEARLDRSARLQVVQDFLRQRLMQSYPLREADDFALPAFEGDLDRLRFITMLPIHLGGGFHEMVLGIVDGGGDPPWDLVVLWRRFDPTAAQEEQTTGPFEQRVLLPAIDDLELAYFGSVSLEQGPDWHLEWREQPELPELVLIRVRFAEDDLRQWPDLVVRPMIDRADMMGF